MSAFYKYSFYLVVLAALGANGVVLLGRRFGHFGSDRNADSKQEEAPFDTMAGLVKPYGYQLEEHFVQTDDGYILRMFRLGPKEGKQNQFASDCKDPDYTTNTSPADDDDEEEEETACSEDEAPTAPLNGSGPRPVVLLQHPLMGSSVDYVVMGPGRSLGFMLVDAGYDVWLTNVRGNRFSRNHSRLDPDSPADRTAFWAFSWDQHVSLDLPAAMDFVAAATGQQRMLFVGYSQGTTIGLAALSSQPRVAARVAAAVLLAPVAFVSHITSPLFRLMATWRLEQVFNRVGLHEYAAHSPRVSELAAAFCGRHPWPCKQYLFLLCGTNPHGNLDAALLPDIMRFLPSGTSVQNMAHWGQLVRSTDPTRLSYFDYGNNCTNAAPDTNANAVYEGGEVVANQITGGYHSCNQEAYNATQPPVYPLHTITTPLALFTGGHDALADPVDSELLQEVLGGMVGSTAVKLHHHEPEYGHLDFGVGHDAADRIYPIVLEFLQNYSPVPAAALVAVS